MQVVSKRRAPYSPLPIPHSIFNHEPHEPTRTKKEENHREYRVTRVVSKPRATCIKKARNP